MFQFSAFAPQMLCIHIWVLIITNERVAPFGNPRVKACLLLTEAYRRFAASFFASDCQGIHRVPLVAFLHRVQAIP